MVHHRERFERVYAPTEAIAPSGLLEPASDAETNGVMWRKRVAFEGLLSLTGPTYTIQGMGERAAALAWRREPYDGTLIELTVEGWRGPRWALAEMPKTSRRSPTVGCRAPGATGDDDHRGGDVPRAARPGQRAQAR